MIENSLIVMLDGMGGRLRRRDERSTHQGTSFVFGRECTAPFGSSVPRKCTAFSQELVPQNALLFLANIGIENTQQF